MLIKLHCPRHTLRVSFFSARYRSPSHLGAHPTEPHAAPAFGLQLAQHLQGMTGYNITGMYNKVIRSKEFDRAQDAVDGFVRLTDRNYNSLVSPRLDRLSLARSIGGVLPQFTSSMADSGDRSQVKHESLPEGGKERVWFSIM